MTFSKILLRAVVRHTTQTVYATCRRHSVIRSRVEGLEQRILFGIYAPYDDTFDPFPTVPAATCPIGSGPGGAGDEGPNSSQTADPALAGGGGATAQSELASPTGANVVPGQVTNTTSNNGNSISSATGVVPRPEGQPALAGAGSTAKPVRDYDGMPLINSTDLLSNGFGAPWGITRTWSGLNSYSLFGNGWSVAGAPYLTVAGVTSSDERIAVVDGGTSSYAFSFSSGSPYGNYTPWGAYSGSLALISGSPDFIRMTDTQGNVTDFYDVYRVSGKPTPLVSFNLSQKYGQFKSYTSANGSTTITASYDGSGYLQTLTRSDASSGDSERLLYTYATVTNSQVTSHSATAPVLTSTVTLQRLISGTRQSEQRALYTYYTGETTPGTSDPNGRLGDLKLVQIQDVGPVVAGASVASGGSVPVGSVYYQVTAVLPQGESSPSMEISVTTTSSNRTVNLSWSAVANATSYKIYRATAAGAEQYLGSTSSASYSDTASSASTGQPPMVNTKYYRYDKFTEENGGYPTLGPTNSAYTMGPDPYQTPVSPYTTVDELVSSGLRTVVEADAFARMAAAVSGYDTASDSTIQPYVNNYFEYERWDDHVGEDGTPAYGAESYNAANNRWFRDGYLTGTRYRATLEIANGSGCSCTGGEGTFKYEYASNYNLTGESFSTADFNTWRMKSTEYLPLDNSDWALHDRSVMYSNEFGQPVMGIFVHVDSSDFDISSMSVPTNLNSDGSCTVTVNTSSAHGYSIGDNIALSGIAPEFFNGVFTITAVPSSTSFQFTLNPNYTGQTSATTAPVPYVNHTIHSQTNHPSTLVSKVVRVLSQQITGYRYDSHGNLVQKAEPSSMSGYDDSLPDPSDQRSGGSVTTDGWVAAFSGLVHSYSYESVSNFPVNEELHQGWYNGGTSIYTLTYGTHSDANGITIEPITASTDINGNVTTYSYAWFPGTNQMSSRTSTLNAIDSSHNGARTSTILTEYYDRLGNIIASVDGGGSVALNQFDIGTGALLKTTVDGATPYLPNVLADQAAGYWRLGEGAGSTAADSSGNYRNGTYSGGYTLAQTGALVGDPDTSASFNGTSGYVQVPYSDALNPAVFSLEASVYLTGGSGTERAILTSRDDGGGSAYSGYELCVNSSNQWELRLGDGSTTWFTLTGSTAATSAWTHLLCTYDGTDACLYVNGTLAASGSASFVANTANPLRIGAGHTEGSAANFFAGRIDEASVYQTALAIERVQAHQDAAAASTAAHNFDDAILASHPATYLRLADGSMADGDPASDLSGNGNDGLYRGSVSAAASSPLLMQPGASVTFDGSYFTYVDLGGPSSATSDVSIDLWFRDGLSAVTTAMGMYLNSNCLHGEINYVDFAVSSPLVPGTWHHAVFTRDSTTASLYLDGALVGTSTASPPGGPASDIALDQYTVGSAAEVSVYNRALSASEVLAHYSACRGSASGTHLALSTTDVIDGLGRVIEETSPAGNETFTIYNDPQHEERVYPGWNSSSHTTTGPIEVSRQYWPAAGLGYLYYTESLTASATPGLSAANLPDGSESLTSSNIQSLSRDFTNDGGQVSWSDAYFFIGGLTYSQTVSLSGGAPADWGTSGTNYYRTAYGYTDMGHVDRVLSPTGTIYRTVYDAEGKVLSQWVGTDDTPTSGYWSPTNTAGTNLMDVEDYVYDLGGVGDGNLTQTTQHADTNSAHDRVSQFLFDFMDRLIAEKDGIQASETDGAHRPITYNVPDAAGNILRTYKFDGDGVDLSDFATDATTDALPSVDAIDARGLIVNGYDEQNRLCRSQVFNIDQSIGIDGLSDGDVLALPNLQTDYFYDHRSDLIATYSPGGLVAKSALDMAGRVTSAYATDGGAVNNSYVPLMAWIDAATVANDLVLTQKDLTYDADGNVILIINRDRFHDAPQTGVGSTGPLADPSTSPSSTGASYSFSEGTGSSAADGSGHGNTAALNGGASWTSSGHGGQALTFDGSTGYAEAPYSASLNPSIFSFSAWVYPTGGSGNYRSVITSRSPSSGIDGFVLYADNSNHWAFWLGTGGSSWAVVSGASVTLNTWTNITCTYDGSAAKIYINGVLSNSLSVSGFVPNPDKPMRIGAGATEGSPLFFFPGTIDQVKIWGSALSATDVSAVYNDQPPARASYQAGYFDAADRMTDSVNVGTNGGSAYIRPGSVPSRSDTTLVTHFNFNDAGDNNEIIDPRNIMTQYNFDMLQRKVAELDNSDGGSPPTCSAETEYAYDGDDNILTMTADFPGTATPSQTTAYIYGTTGTALTNLFSNDLIVKVEYPTKIGGSAGTPSTSASDDVSYTYDLQGETLTATDQNGSTHAFSYDILGRLSLDAVTTLGSGVDGAVRALGASYDALGLPYQETSYSDSGATTVINQVQDDYNGYGELITQWQEHSGAVNGSSLKVQYGYDQPSSTNYSRLSSITYPNGRALDYVYDSGLDSDISRISALADDAGTGTGDDESYAYLGLGTIVQGLDGNGIELTYIHQTGDTLSSSDGGDQNTGLDRFGRVIDQWYRNTSGGATTDRFQYGYDRGGNVLYKSNLLSSSFSELYHANSGSSGDNSSAYDNLNRLTGFRRGTLSASGNNGSSLDTVTTLNSTLSANKSQSLTLDALGNQTSVTTDGTSVSRTVNSQNELTAIGGSSLMFDSNGNTTTDDHGHTLIYDAWNHLIAVKNGGTTLVSYSHDASADPITRTAGGTAVDLYVSVSGQVLEERQGSSVTNQYVWGLAFTNDPVLRDDNSSSGNYGKSSSGLGRRVFYQQGANYDVTSLVSSGGTVLQRYVYTPYGVAAVLTAAWGNSTESYSNLYTFQGGRSDPTTGMIQFGYRPYSASMGRWLESDPLGCAGGVNLYEFVNGNPVGATDVFGFSSDKADGIPKSVRDRMKNLKEHLKRDGCTLVIPEAAGNQAFGAGAGFISADTDPEMLLDYLDGIIDDMGNDYWRYMQDPKFTEDINEMQNLARKLKEDFMRSYNDPNSPCYQKCPSKSLSQTLGRTPGAGSQSTGSDPINKISRLVDPVMGGSAAAAGAASAAPESALGAAGAKVIRGAKFIGEVGKRAAGILLLAPGIFFDAVLNNDNNRNRGGWA